MACVFYFLTKLFLVMPNGWYFLKEFWKFRDLQKWQRMLRNILNYYLKKYDSEATKRQCQFASCLYIYFKYRILKMFRSAVPYLKISWVFVASGGLPED